ncbi:hypothetical protein [Nonomuraea polychroma]|nr:hypothetical protein [Nonomuraea polychroma]
MDGQDMAVAAKDEVWMAEVGEYGGWQLSRWDGSNWKEVRKPGGDPRSLERVAASGAGQIWAIQAGHDETQAIRWEGSRWSVHPLPQVAVPAPSPTTAECISTGWPRFSIEAMAVPTPDDAWAVGSVLVEKPGACMHYMAKEGVVLHWEGGEWRRVERQLTGTALTVARADTAGGVWIAANPVQGRRPYLLHVRDGRWTEHPLPEGPTEIMDIAPVPGTTRVWVYTRRGSGVSQIYEFA